MSETLASSAFFGVLISLGLYWLGAALKKRLRLAIANPLLIAIGGTIVCLLLTGVDYADYSAAARPLSFLLTPATVCLAVPLYRQLPLMRRYWKAVLGGIAMTGGTGTMFGTFLGLLVLLTLNNGLLVLGVTTYWQNVAKGVVLVFALALDFYRTKRRNKVKETPHN